MIRYILACITLCGVAIAQNVPAPQIGLSGNVGAIGFPILNSGTFQMPADANVTFAGSNVNTSAFAMKVTSAVSLTATRNLVYPAGRFYVTVENATTGGQAIQIIGPSGTGVSVPNGSTVTVWNDGTNYVLAGANGGTTANGLLMNNSGTGSNSGTTFNGSAPQTISYNTVGAAPATGSTNYVQTSPSATQTIAQPSGTTLSITNATPSSTVVGVPALEVFDPYIYASGGAVGINVGTAGTQGNTAYIDFQNFGNDNASNAAFFGVANPSGEEPLGICTTEAGYIGFGFSITNANCASGASSGVPIQFGAAANLYTGTTAPDQSQGAGGTLVTNENYVAAAVAGAGGNYVQVAPSGGVSQQVNQQSGTQFCFGVITSGVCSGLSIGPDGSVSQSSSNATSNNSFYSGINQTFTAAGFNSLNGPNVHFYNNVASTSGTNYGGPQITSVGTYWTGSASALNLWVWQDVMGSGSNPTSTLTLSQPSGTSGYHSVSMPFEVDLGSSSKVNGSGICTGATGCPSTTGSLSGMTTGQVPIAATATTVTSSKALGGSGTYVATIATNATLLGMALQAANAVAITGGTITGTTITGTGLPTGCAQLPCVVASVTNTTATAPVGSTLLYVVPSTPSAGSNYQVNCAVTTTVAGTGAGTMSANTFWTDVSSTAQGYTLGAGANLVTKGSTNNAGSGVSVPFPEITALAGSGIYYSTSLTGVTTGYTYVYSCQLILLGY